MNRKSRIQEITKIGAIAVIRLNETLPLKPVTEALFNGGIRATEVTLTTPNALSTIEELRQFHGPEMLIGAGSVITKQQVQDVALAGGDFIVSPITKKEVIDQGHILDLPVMPGALTPTEVQTAYEYGAGLIKIFPASQFGLSYIKALLAPFPNLKLVPTGGVTPENAGQWIHAGALAVGVGSALVDKEVINNHQVSEITARASTLCRNIARAKKQLHS
ncbi:MAG: bifunctional 4-hydroxy-2-oxoglutarate aldolase/2-dehydro-3-deoxy-phosphogluconate aldolase [Bacteroidetes bacterium]|nr:bifunctional 4-hydroxy-2-oxoglutarate aldolase/2-dehydro-3-deoxy-phosphogluconate aldolase [Bacteroidota bacterium]